MYVPQKAPFGALFVLSFSVFVSTKLSSFVLFLRATPSSQPNASWSSLNGVTLVGYSMLFLFLP